MEIGSEKMRQTRTLRIFLALLFIMEIIALYLIFGMFKEGANPSSKMKIDSEYGQMVAVACKEVRDLNKNGFIDYPQEYIGQNYSFNRNETMGIALTFTSAVNKAVFVKIIGPNGQKATEVTAPPEANGSGIFNFKPNTFSPGVHKAYIYVKNTTQGNDKLVQNIRFEIK